MQRTILPSVILIALFQLSCQPRQYEVGTKENPVKFYFTPSVDAEVITNTSRNMMDFMHKETGYFFKTGVPTSYITVIEALGSARADVAIINSFGYLMAHTKYGVEARLKLIRFGEPYYRGQIIAHVNSGIHTINDIAGKRFAYVDASSTSGYLFPYKLLKSNGVEPSQTVFAMKHDNVVTMVYQQQVDAGATYYSPPTADGRIRDARDRVRTQFPDVEQKVKIIALTDTIPNDPVIFRSDLSTEMKTKITNAIIKYSGTAEGKKTLHELYNIEGFVAADNDDFESFRQMIKILNVDLNELIK